MPRSKVVSLRTNGVLLAKVAAATVVAALALTACGGSSHSGSKSDSSHVTTGPNQGPSSDTHGTPQASNVPPSSSIPKITSEAAMAEGRAFPLATYALTGPQIDLVNQALYLLTSKCMQGQGFTMPAYTPAPNVPAENPLVVAFGAGILSEVKQYGYDEPAKYIGPQKPATPDPAGTETNNPAYQNALLGPEADRPQAPPVSVGGHQISGTTYTPGSCTGRAYSQLGISDARQLALGGGSSQVANLNIESSDRTKSDPRVLAVIKEWSACMARSGFTAATPTVAANTYGPKAKNLAIAAATADVECKYQTNYFGIMYAVTAAYQTQLVNDGLSALETLKDTNTKLLAKANSVIQSS